MSKQTNQKARWGVMKLNLILIVFIILFISYASAFGIGSAYHKDRSLELSPGETKEIIFNLQNMPGPEDITARVSIIKGSEILELIDLNDIFVPVGGSIDVKAIVSIPINAEIGDTYPIEIAFTTMVESDSGTFGFGSSVKRNFDVIVVPTAEERARLAEQKPIALWRIYLLIGILILIIIVIIIGIRNKKRKKK